MSAAISPVTVEIAVPLAPSAAFELFTAGFDGWWPRTYTWGQDAVEWIGLEPKIGGRCTERGPAGFQCDWGQVRVWAPPARVELNWQISPRREPVPDPAKASRLAVRFLPEEDGTRLVLEHGDFARHGKGAAEYRAAMASDEGWPFILDCYLKAAKANVAE